MCIIYMGYANMLPSLNDTAVNVNKPIAIYMYRVYIHIYMFVCQSKTIRIAKS